MKIQKGSWHYRLIDFFDLRHPDNLCAYFWKVVFAGLIGIGVSFVIIPMAICLVLSPFVALALHFLIGPSPDSVIFHTAVIVVMAIVVISAFLAVICGIPWLYEKSRDGLEATGVPDSIVVEYVKAKHRKICPLIEFE